MLLIVGEVFLSLGLLVVNVVTCLLDSNEYADKKVIVSLQYDSSCLGDFGALRV